MTPALRNILRTLPAAWLAATPAAQGWTTDTGETVTPPNGSLRLASPDDPEAQQAVMRLLLEEQVRADGPAFALAVLRDGELLFAGARGMEDIERGVPASADTVFDMASITKSVTGAAIATLIETGDVRLDASVREYLPELSETYAPVLVRHLVHHTGGVEDTEGMLALAGWRADDPGTFADALRVLGSLQHLRFEPGTMHLYSNGGYVLLAAIVERVTGESFPAWTNEHLFRPSGIRSARFATGDGALVPHRATPYAETPDATGGRIRRARETSRYGAGGLLVSVVDLARWADTLRTGRGLADGIAELVREPGRLNDGSPVDYAFGLVPGVQDGREVWSHAGSEPGGQSYFAFWPNEGVAIAAATSSLETVSPASVVRDVVALLLGPGETSARAASGPRMVFIDDRQVRPEESQGVTVDPARLGAYAGTYEMEDGLSLVVGNEGQRLLIGFASEPTIEVFPIGADAFLLPQPGWELHFDPAADRLRMHVRESARTGEPLDIGGERLVLAPLTEARARDLIGTYRSAELDAVYTLAWRDGALSLEHPRHGRLPLTPLAEDRYTLPGHSLAKLTLVRADGAVRGFELEAFSWGATSFFARL